MMLALALSASAFAFVVDVDPMTDAKTYLAQIGTDQGPSIVLFCGAASEHKLRAAVNVGSSLYARPFSRFATYRSRVRFGNAPPSEFGFQYVGSEALVSDSEVARFAEGLRGADFVTVELYDYANKTVTVRYPTAGIGDSLAKVEARCAADR